MFTEETDLSKTVECYDEVLKYCRDLMLKKNADYGDSWRRMRATSITDQILTKVERIKSLEDLDLAGKSSKVAEGIDYELTDIINYSVFEIIQRKVESNSRTNMDHFQVPQNVKLLGK